MNKIFEGLVAYIKVRSTINNHHKMCEVIFEMHVILKLRKWIHIL